MLELLPSPGPDVVAVRVSGTGTEADVRGKVLRSVGRTYTAPKAPA